MAQTWVELTLILTRAVGSYSNGPTDESFTNLASIFIHTYGQHILLT